MAVLPSLDNTNEISVSNVMFVCNVKSLAKFKREQDHSKTLQEYADS